MSRSALLRFQSGFTVETLTMTRCATIAPIPYGTFAQDGYAKRSLAGQPVADRPFYRSIYGARPFFGNILRMAETPDKTTPAAHVSFSEAGGVAMAAILHLFRLVTAELVLHRGLDMQRLEAAAHQKIVEFSSPTNNQQVKEVGIAFARELLNEVFVQIRAQAELKRRLSAPPSEMPSEGVPWSVQSSLLH
jgi:hypothetical protein